MAENHVPTMGAQDQADAIYDARKLGAPKMTVFGLQHMFAMFGATILVPVLTGLSVQATLLFHFIARGKVPAFLGSSFAFIAGYAAIAPNGEAELLPYACLGVACAGLLYLVLAALFKAFGANRVMRYFPPVVTGPIVIYIGLILASSAIAAVFAIAFSFCPKFAAVIGSMPASVIGGVSLVLYGMISAVGLRNLVENQVDFMATRNVLIAAVILVLAIGIAYSDASTIVIPAGSITISLSGLAIGSLVGIVLNIVLPGKDKETPGVSVVDEADAAAGASASTSSTLPLEGPHPYDPNVDPNAR